MKNSTVAIGLIGAVVIAGVIYLAMRSPVAPTDNTPIATTTDNGTTPPPAPPTSPIPTTPGQPSATTNAKVAPTDTTAVVTGSVVPTGAITTYWYEYGTTQELGKKTSDQIIGSGYVAIATPGYITGLTKNTTYYFKLMSKNEFGVSSGAIDSFTTSAFSSTPVGGIASATTQAANAITEVSATLRGMVNPNKTTTQYWFEVGMDRGLGGVTSFVAAGDGSTAIQAEAVIPNLAPGTTYYFRINAQNQYGTVNGAILSFKTAGKLVVAVPVVTTQVSSAIATTTAVLNGTVNPYGSLTSYWFEYGTDSSFGNSTKTTAKKSAGTVTTTVTVQTTLSGLKTNTTYYVRIVAQNPGGTVKGDSQSFKTK